MNVLIAGVGYRNLRDLSLGPRVVDRLSGLPWVSGGSASVHHVEVEDLSYNPIAVVQRFQAERPRYRRIVLLAGVARGRAPGTIHVHRWSGHLPDADEIQARIGEAVTGVISLDNLLIIGQHFGIWPDDVVIIEVEPADENWGPGFSSQVADAIPEVIETVRREALAVPKLTHAPQCPTLLTQDDTLDAVFWQDEILQVLYWFRGEGLGETVVARDLVVFLNTDEAVVQQHLDRLVAKGFAERTVDARYRLTQVGLQEGGRRFAEAFAGLTGQAHGECNDPRCACQTLGPEACEARSVDGH